MDKYIETPLTKEKVKELHAGDYVYITGTVYTARDAAHKRMVEQKEQGMELPFIMKDQIIYYLGPTPNREGQVIGSAGPTTSSRMDKNAPTLLDEVLTGMIGKGKTLLVHDDCVVSRVAHRLEELCGEIELCQSILKNAADLPTEYRRSNKEQVRQRLEMARWNLDDLLEDIEDGIVARELKRIYYDYCGGGDDGEV